MKLYFGLLLCLGWLALTTAQGDGGTCITVEGLVRDGCPRTCIMRDEESDCQKCNMTCARVGSDECVSVERLVNVLGCRRDCVTTDEDTGCPECDETCMTCPLVLCAVFCPNGYEFDEDTGCQTCECVEGCPVTASELVEQGECSRECIVKASDRGCPMCDPECADVEPECSTDDDCEEGEICVTVGDFGVAECVDVPSEGESCSADDEEDSDETELEELEEDLLAGGSISGVVDRALVDLVGSVEVSCEDGFRCSSEGTCEPVDGPCSRDSANPSCDDEGNYRPLQCFAVGGEEGTYRCYCVHPNGTRVPGTEEIITERGDAPDCVGLVFEPCKYRLNGQEYAVRHGEEVVDFTRCVRCRCRDGEFVGCVDTDADDCDAIDDGDEPEGCQFRGRRLAHGDRVQVDECNVCGCRDGRVVCTELDCGDDDSGEEDVCDRCRRLARRLVCGADGRTHLSRCFAQNCSGLRDIDILDGPCRLRDVCRQYPCPRGETCLRRGGISCLRRGGCDRDDLRLCVNTNLLRCRNALSNIDETVCASNGRSYASVCRMLQDTSNVQVDHTGRCDKPECNTGPVCGTDGVTYRNLCVLRSRSANARVDHRGECDEDDDTPSDDVCARVRDAGRCEYNRDNCDRLVRPEEGCCPVCGGVVQIALDRSRLQAYVEVNPSVDSLDQFIESLIRAGFFPDGLDDQCEVEISLTRRSNMEIVLRARRASDEDACFQASAILVERVNDPALSLSTVPLELEFASAAASAPLIDEGSGASAAVFSYLTLAIAYGLTQIFF